MIHADDRGVSPVISTILMVAIVVILAASISVFVLDFGEGLDDPAPVVSKSSGELVADVPGSNDQRVSLTHRAGDTLRVRNIELVVDAGDVCGKHGRLVNLPAPGGDPQPTEDYVRGDDLFDNSANSLSGPIGEDGVTVDGRWSAGETAVFRIANSECSLSEGDEITVMVVHTPSNSVLIEEELTAT